MKKIRNLLFVILLAVALIAPTYTAFVSAQIVTPATGYTKASDVKYVYKSGYTLNWGARGETCTFLTTKAQDFYGANDFDHFSTYQGGTSQSNAPQSALYKQLQSYMKLKHTHETNYQETRYQYQYTDCLKSDNNYISSFYSGKQISGTWDSGATWNREHTWPNSKGDASGNGENDIMMLRPTSVSENSSRGNKAYGESGSFYDPGESVRGDCARIVLYVYTRWGNTTSMWGSSGVMESLTVLLKWMQEDPVDTWEMGRNDAVQSITGTRNVFVDYPEYAFMLFGREIPANMPTPFNGGKGSDIGGGDSSTDSSADSSIDVGGGDSSIVVPDCEHSYVAVDMKQPTETEEGYIISVCILCGEENREVIPATGSGNDSSSNVGGGDSSIVVPDCEHSYVAVDMKQPTETEEGYIISVCILCGEENREVIPVIGSGNDSSVEGGSSGGESASDQTSSGVSVVPAPGCQGVLGSSTILLTVFALSVAIIVKKKEF